jgi:uncharacterized protein YjbI with pentapeptide repeats
MTPQNSDDMAARHEYCSQTINRMFLAIVGFSLFCVVTLGGSDEGLVGVGAEIGLPFSGVKMTARAFVIVGPLILIALTAYMHLFIGEWIKLNDCVDSTRRMASFFNLESTSARLLTNFSFYVLTPCILLFFCWKALPLPSAFQVESIALVGITFLLWLWIRRCDGRTRLLWNIPKWAFLLCVIIPSYLYVWFTDKQPPRALSLQGSDLRGKDLFAFNLARADLSRANLTKANLSKANLSEADLTRAILDSADLTSANLTKTILDDVSAKAATFAGADMTGSNALRADFTGSDLSGSTLSGSKFIVANLSGTNLQRSEILGTNFTSAKLIGADLQHAKLDQVDTRNTDMTGVKFGYAIFSNVSLEGANGLKQQQIQSICMKGLAVFPPGITFNSNRGEYCPTTILVSLNKAREQGNGDSLYPGALSKNGRFICFGSAAANLVANDTNGHVDIFIRDLRKGETRRVNVSSNGEQANSGSSACALSGNGRHVVFTSDATNLVSDDTNGRADVFVHDRKTGNTSRVSVNSGGEQGNDGSGGTIGMSSDGRLVVFTSNASNLVPEDTNNFDDIFLHDRDTNTTTRVNVNSAGKQASGCVLICQGSPTISGNGRYIAFDSSATNLVSGDTNGKRDVFVRDLKSGITTRVSTNSLGAEGNKNSFMPRLSDDGLVVAFGSEASNLVAGDSNNVEDAFVYDFQYSGLKRVSVSSTGAQANAGSFNYSLSGDGRFVAFSSGATNLVFDDTNEKTDIFVHDIETRETVRVSVDDFGKQGNGDSDGLSPLNRNGHYIAFGSYASNLVLSDLNGMADSFIYERRGDNRNESPKHDVEGFGVDNEFDD